MDPVQQPVGDPGPPNENAVGEVWPMFQNAGIVTSPGPAAAGTCAPPGETR